MCNLQEIGWEHGPDLEEYFEYGEYEPEREVDPDE